jgi:hypothetical protein
MHTDRWQAIQAGDSQYQGKSCKRGHDGRRYVLTRNCVQCEAERKRTERQTVREAREAAKRSGDDD